MSKQLHDWNNDLLPEKLDKMEDDVRWIAEVSGKTITFHKLIVVRRTPKGMWVRAEHGCEETWRSTDSNRATLTRRAALHHLWRRKRSYVRHSERRLSDAYKAERAARKTLNDTGSSVEAPRSKFFYTPQRMKLFSEDT